jgi:ATP-dependent helicase/nuclease subunit A
MTSHSPQSQPRELKPEQQSAAHTLDRHLSVTAGPGSGKTTVLVERYLEILRTQKVSVDNIVAITFTNRAANEMRQRVRTKIDELLRDTSGDERQTWLRHKRALEAAVVTTIHGFCSRLLHEFPVEANIDPQFVLLDEHQSAMMLEAVVEETLTDALHHGNEKIVLLTQGATRPVLASALVELYRRYRGEGLSLEAIEKLSAKNHAAEAEYSMAFKALEAAMAELIATRGLSRDAERKRGKAAQEWPALRRILSRPPTDHTIAAYCQGIEDLWEARPRKGSTPVIERLDELLWDAKSSDRLRGRVPCLGFDLLAKDYSLALLKLVGEIDRRLEFEKQRLSVLDFDDLQLRTLQLLARTEVLTRVTERYRYFLVDEFQDTNGLQRDLMNRLALGRGANLFIVGDRKQSIYGFRGADVDVFSEMTAAIVKAGGTPQPLLANFRSQKPLIDAFNFLFARIFTARAEVPAAELPQLGFVEHEPSVAERVAKHEPPLVELMVSILNESKTTAADSEEGAEESDPLGAQERDAEQVAARIRSLVDAGSAGILPASLGNARQDVCAPGFNYGDIAILFRAFTGVWTYESALRRAGIPYLTVQGKGFYQREEITDLIQLLRFLDNTTDELALAAVLRSPLGGISDNALLALRCAPRVTDVGGSERLHRRNLRRALRTHREIQFIDETEHVALDRFSAWLDALTARRNRYSISELLRFAVASSEFLVVIAANFDGAQRVANVEKLFRLAEQFEKSGYLIRDFVRYVEEFEAIGGRESEGQMDESANVVRLMTIHQAKGLEFPVVMIPDLHREQNPRDAWYALDRHRGFSVRVPDGRGRAVRGSLFNQLRQRARWREEFESMRLLYVAATRAEDRLIFSGAIARKDLQNLAKTEREKWLAWIWQALELAEHPQSGVLSFDGDVTIQLKVNRGAETLRTPGVGSPREATKVRETLDLSRPMDELFPLLQPITVERGQALRRFSVTQLINFQRCARQYYFDRLLRAPGAEERAIWNDAEAPEPPANLTATLKGAVIHRFCETFRGGDDPETRLRASFNEVVAQRQAELAGRVFEIDREQAVLDLMPLAQNYLASDVFQRVTALDRFNAEFPNPQSAIRNSKSLAPGLWSELRFRLRRPLGILTGTIDKLLIKPAANGQGFDVEVIDFKTNRLSRQVSAQRVRRATATFSGAELKTENRSQPAQGLFDFDQPPEEDAKQGPGNETLTDSDASLAVQAESLAHDYQLQMQAYALALRELLPQSVRVNSLRATLHFIEPNLEVTLAPDLLERDNCMRMIDEAMLQIASLEGTLDAEAFPPLPATHCRICNFLELCPAGREWLSQNRAR